MRKGFFFICCWLVVSAPSSVFAYAPMAFEGVRFKSACKGGLQYLWQDQLGSLLVAVAGVGAIISAAIGGFRMAWALLVVSVGTYLLSDFIQGDTVKWFSNGSC